MFAYVLPLWNNLKESISTRFARTGTCKKIILKIRTLLDASFFAAVLIRFPLFTHTQNIYVSSVPREDLRTLSVSFPVMRFLSYGTEPHRWCASTQRERKHVQRRRFSIIINTHNTYPCAFRSFRLDYHSTSWLINESIAVTHLLLLPWVRFSGFLTVCPFFQFHHVSASFRPIHHCTLLLVFLLCTKKIDCVQIRSIVYALHFTDTYIHLGNVLFQCLLQCVCVFV